MNNSFLATVIKTAENTTVNLNGNLTSRCVVNFKLNQSGEQVKVWGNQNDYILFDLKYQEQVFLSKAGRNFKLMGRTQPRMNHQQPPQYQPYNSNIPTYPTTTIPTSPTIPTTRPPNKGEQVKDFIRQNVKLYKGCFNEVSDQMQDFNLSDDNLRAISTTVYLSVMKKYS